MLVYAKVHNDIMSHRCKQHNINSTTELSTNTQCDATNVFIILIYNDIHCMDDIFFRNDRSHLLMPSIGYKANIFLSSVFQFKLDRQSRIDFVQLCWDYTSNYKVNYCAGRHFSYSYIYG